MLVAAKARQAVAHGLDVMICLGETLGEREAGKAEQVVIDQLRISVPDDMPQSRLMIAYEPVWAIGTGEVASLDDIVTMHSAIASELQKSQDVAAAAKAPILYGGSVNAENAAAIFALDNVHGGLVGGASLDAKAFGSICDSARSRCQNSSFGKLGQDEPELSCICGIFVENKIKTPYKRQSAPTFRKPKLWKRWF